MKKILLSVLTVIMTTGILYAIPKQAKVAVRKPVEAILKQMRTYNMYESRYVGFAGSESEQYVRFQSLVKTANVTELTYLARYDKNAAVRIYSFLALKQKDEAKALKLVPVMNKDTASVNTLIGCIGGKKAVNQLLNEEGDIE